LRARLLRCCCSSPQYAAIHFAATPRRRHAFRHYAFAADITLEALPHAVLICLRYAYFFIIADKRCPLFDDAATLHIAAIDPISPRLFDAATPLCCPCLFRLPDTIATTILFA